MEKNSAYQWAAVVGVMFAVGFYVFDYFYLNLNPLIRYCGGVSIIALTVFAAIILKARSDESTRVSIARRFGEVVAHDDKSLSFRRKETLFNWEAIFGGHKAGFFLPEIKQRFYIQNQSSANAEPKSMLAQMLDSTSQSWTDSATDCKPVEVSRFPSEVKLYSRNAEYLQSLLSDPRFGTALDKYLFDNFKIAFDEGNFEFSWQTGSNEESSDFRRICQTTIVFHDAISALSDRTPPR